MNTNRILLLAMIWYIACGPIARADVRIKDITTVEGVRSNKLYGVGLVVGLNNTGARSLATQQVAIDLLRKMELTTKIARQSLNDNVFKSSNIAMVTVSAELSGVARKGSKLDVKVAVFDDATSLEGGVLLPTPLRGVDGTDYALAQGDVSIGGFRVRQTGGGQQNHPTVGIVPSGADVEREALDEIPKSGFVKLLIRRPDHATASNITKVINEEFPSCAKTVDHGTVQIKIPQQHARAISDFLAEIGQLNVQPDSAARIVINERTGTVIVGHKVRISAVAIASGNLVIKPNSSAATPPPTTTGPSGSLLPLPNAQSNLDGGAESFAPDAVQSTAESEPTYTVAELARILNLLGVSPRDLINIFEMLEAHGALHAELVIK